VVGHIDNYPKLRLLKLSVARAEQACQLSHKMQFLLLKHKLIIIVICLQGKHERPAATVIATSENVTLNSVERLDSGTYECTAKNDKGPEVSAQVSIRITCKYGLNLWL
jgi:hypothetical protein